MTQLAQDVTPAFSYGDGEVVQALQEHAGHEGDFAAYDQVTPVNKIFKRWSYCVWCFKRVAFDVHKTQWSSSPMTTEGRMSSSTSSARY